MVLGFFRTIYFGIKKQNKTKQNKTDVELNTIYSSPTLKMN